MTFTVLDLFSGAGGVARGYHDAGFEVVGVDIKRQPRYPYEFHQADAIEYLKAMVTFGFRGVDAIHASPPCQRWSVAAASQRKKGKVYPELIEPTRFLLKRVGLPYVIENVPGAPLIDPVTLCGSHFNLTAEFGEYGTVALRRHRLFESNFPVPDPGEHDHSLPTITVLDGSGTIGDRKRFGRNAWKNERRQLMQIDWMNRHELAESIPPPYTRYIGRYLAEYLSGLTLAVAS